MINIENLFYNEIKEIISQWDEEGIYAISFFVESNESYEYDNFSNVSNFAISYNTEDDCVGAGKFDEERWNYAFWRQDEVFIVDVYERNSGAEQLFQWYEENNIVDIGNEDENCYDKYGGYIGRGPVGHYELLQIVANIALRLQKEGFLVERFNHKIPIIIHGLEYTWYDIEATIRANPNHEADDFLFAMEKLGFM